MYTILKGDIQVKNLLPIVQNIQCYLITNADMHAEKFKLHFER